MLSLKKLSTGNIMSFLVAMQTIERSLTQISLLFGHFIKGVASGTRVFQVSCLQSKWNGESKKHWSQVFEIFFIFDIHSHLSNIHTKIHERSKSYLGYSLTSSNILELAYFLVFWISILFFQFINLESKVPLSIDSTKIIPPFAFKGDIQFEDITFSYPTRPEQVTFQNIFQASMASRMSIILKCLSILGHIERFQFKYSRW